MTRRGPGGVGTRSFRLIALTLPLFACSGAETPPHLRIAGADAERGAEAMARFGCGSCHRIPGIAGARGLAGPPLDHFGERAMIAGQLPNRPSILIAWIMDPPRLVPGTGMPDMAVPENDARDMAAYLYSLQADESIRWPPEVPPDRPRYDEPNRPD